MKELIARVGPSDANVLITGEHGTGKEVVARTLHQVSPRAARTLVAVNAGGLAEGVFESELFGHVKGAFTDARVDRVGRFELADGGTLFLDEIANVPLNLQAKLLRVLETGEIERVGASKPRHVSVRVISATNVDPAAEVTAGRFREDLLFRLNTIEIHLPPLRERKMDIPILAMHFLAQYHDRYRRPVSNFDDAALVALVEHTWPGNVRELDHTVERAVLLAEGPVIRPSNLGLRASRDGKLAVLHENAQSHIAFLRRLRCAPRGLRTTRRPGRFLPRVPALGHACLGRALHVSERRHAVPRALVALWLFRHQRHPAADAHGLPFALAHARKVRVFDDRRRAVPLALRARLPSLRCLACHGITYQLRPYR